MGAAHCAAEGCHRLFSTVGLFDAHRHSRGERGGCVDPEKITNSRGDRVLFFRDGMWRGPELTDEQKAARFGKKAS